MAGKKKILLIDDEEDFCFFVKNNLEQTEEFSVSYTTNPDKGIRIARKDPPDLILLDILMPKKDGFSVLEILKKHEKTLSVPVIMLTAVGQDEAKIRAARGYSEYYITKPASLETLRTKIDAVFKIHRLSQ
jgi:two-component system alkaline phosphatase synthesis response regulator PhoP